MLQPKEITELISKLRQEMTVEDTMKALPEEHQEAFLTQVTKTALNLMRHEGYCGTCDKCREQASMLISGIGAGIALGYNLGVLHPDALWKVEKEKSIKLPEVVDKGGIYINRG